MTTKRLQYPDLDLAKIVGIVGIQNGGTTADTAPVAVTNLGGISRSRKGQANGPVPLDINSKIDISFFDIVSGGYVTITGPAVLQSGQVGVYTITNLDSFKLYNVSPIAGSVSRSGSSINYTAPLVGGMSGFNINGRDIGILIVVPTIVQPTVTITNLNTANGSAFSVSINTDIHQSTDWQLATDIDFTNIVDQLVDSTSNKLTWPLNNLNVPVTYYVRARYKGMAYGYSNWSNVVSFTTLAAPAVNQPTIISPVNNSVNNSNVPSFNASAYSAINGADTHQSSDWQISEDINFLSTTDWIEDNTTHKTTWTNLQTVLKVNTIYYARVRYKSANGVVSPWSPVINFRTFNSAVVNFTVTPSVTTVNEGNSVTFNITADSIPNGSLLKYNIVVGSPPTYASANDFGTGGNANSPKGSFVFNNNTSSFVVTTFIDSLLESSEIFYAEILTAAKTRNDVTNTFTDNINTHLEDQSVNVTIVDSPAPTYNITVKDHNNITLQQPYETFEFGITRFYVTTTNIPGVAELFWEVTGSGITAGDFTSGQTTGTLFINNNTGSANIEIYHDGLIEGDETFTFSIKTGSSNGPTVASVNVKILDYDDINPWLMAEDYDSNFNDPVDLVNNGEPIDGGGGRLICYTNHPVVNPPMITSGSIPPGTVVQLYNNQSPSGPPYSEGMYSIFIYGTPTAAGTYTATFQVSNLLYYSGAPFLYQRTFTKTFIVSNLGG